MKPFSFTIIALLCGVAVFSQVQYRDSLFYEIDMTTHAITTVNDSVLGFDLYRPKEGTGLLPLLVYVHGGGFSGGSRGQRVIVDFATSLARRGYAVASVSYRLTMKGIGFGCDVPAGQKVEAINSASYDVARHVKYLLEHAGEYRINPKLVVLAGSSAGAETVLNMAYGGQNLDLSSGFRFAGVIAMAGATVSIDHVTAATAIPTQMFHGTSDALVPYGCAPHRRCQPADPGFLMLYGSKPLSETLKALERSYYLVTIEGGSHSWASMPMTRCFNDIVDFLYGDVVNPKGLRQTQRVLFSQE